MNDLIIDGSEKLPTIKFLANGQLSVFGRCIPENAVEFFEPIEKWMDHYAESPNPETTLEIFLDYFNTSSSKCILDLFRQLEAIVQAGNTSGRVIWKFIEEDEDMEEAGEDYSSIVDVPFDLQEINP